MCVCVCVVYVQATDETFLEKLDQRCAGNNPHYESRALKALRSDQSMDRNQFRLIHYAGNVSILPTFTFTPNITYLPTFTPPHPHTITHLPIFTPSHPHTITHLPMYFHPHTLTPSPISLFSHPHTLTPSPISLCTFTLTPSHPHPSPYSHTPTPSHQVTYTVGGFLEKNRDLLFKDLSRAMFTCERPLLKSLFPEGQRSHTLSRQLYIHVNGLATLYIQNFRHPPYGHVIILHVCGARHSPPARDLSYRCSLSRS